MRFVRPVGRFPVAIDFSGDRAWMASDFEEYIPQGQSLASPYPYLLPFLYAQLHVGLHTSLSYSKGHSSPQSVALAS